MVLILNLKNNCIKLFFIKFVIRYVILKDIKFVIIVFVRFKKLIFYGIFFLDKKYMLIGYVIIDNKEV